MGTLVLKNIFIEVLTGSAARPKTRITVPGTPVGGTGVLIIPNDDGTFRRISRLAGHADGPETGVTWRIQRLDVKIRPEGHK